MKHIIYHWQLASVGLLVTLTAQVCYSLHQPLTIPSPSTPPTTVINNFQFAAMSTQQTAELTAELSSQLANKNSNRNASLISGIEQAAKKLSSDSWSYFQQHKLLCCATVLLGAYLYSLYHSLALTHNLERPEQLQNWKNSYDLNQLLTLPQAGLLTELDQLIKQQYESHFKAEIERELGLANQYLRLAQIVQMLRLTRFYPVSPTRIKQVEAQISRLSYLKQLFHTWQQTRLSPEAITGPARTLPEALAWPTHLQPSNLLS